MYEYDIIAVERGFTDGPKDLIHKAKDVANKMAAEGWRFVESGTYAGTLFLTFERVREIKD